jgi:hypothetical protein
MVDLDADILQILPDRVRQAARELTHKMGCVPRVAFSIVDPEIDRPVGRAAKDNPFPEADVDFPHLPFSPGCGTMAAV